ncbi:transposon mariner sub-class [Hordeum vulgare]|nr:transposon mariner sub-class [Hordeum vulgare]
MFATGVGTASGSDGGTTSGSGGGIANQRAQQVCSEQQFVVPSSVPVRRVGLMRPHGSSLVGRIGSMFATGVGTASGSDDRIASQRAQEVCSEEQFGRSGSVFASGAGASSGSANEPVQPVRRVGLSRRQPSSRASSLGTTTHSLNLGGGFSIDLSSSFFQGVRGSSNGNTGESSEHGGSRGFGHVQASGNGLGGDDNASGGGYRGDGYNASFENADEYPPSIPQVQPANLPPAIDLNVLANKKTRKFYSTEEKRLIYSWILKRNGTSTKLKHGVSAAVAELAKCPRRVVTRIWKQGLKEGGINNVKCMRKMKCGRKKINLDIDALEAIPTSERTTLRQLAEAINMPTTTVFRRLKEKQIRRVSSELKPMLTEENKKTRVLYCLQHIEPSIFQDTPTFKAGFNTVHIDEKWFYRIKKKENVYLSHREEAPQRETKNKGHIQKTMFLSAMARPRYDAQGNCIFDGKIGVWAYVDWVQAQKKSANRKRGEWEIKPSTEWSS